MSFVHKQSSLSIEGYPFIIRFKTHKDLIEDLKRLNSIEGYPFIIRFKTLSSLMAYKPYYTRY